jgi:hypothetical protein
MGCGYQNLAAGSNVAVAGVDSSPVPSGSHNHQWTACGRLFSCADCGYGYTSARSSLQNPTVLSNPGLVTGDFDL